MLLKSRIVLVSEFGGNLVADVDELAERRIVERVGLIVAHSAGVGVRIPFLHLRRRRQGVDVHVDDGGVRHSKLRHTSESVDINLLRELESLRVSHGEAYVLLKPGSTCGLDVDTLVVFLYETAHYRVDGELVGAGVDAELEVVHQSELLDGIVDYEQVLLEFLLELLDVPAIVHALVEASGELRRYGLRWHLLL